MQTSVFSSLILDNDFGLAVWHSIEQKRLGQTVLTMLPIISPSWGGNNYGQLANDSKQSLVPTPVDLPTDEADLLRVFFKHVIYKCFTFSMGGEESRKRQITFLDENETWMWFCEVIAAIESGANHIICLTRPDPTKAGIKGESFFRSSKLTTKIGQKLGDLKMPCQNPKGKSVSHTGSGSSLSSTHESLSFGHGTPYVSLC